jgi:LPS export ABC transporter protein LptC
LIASSNNTIKLLLRRTLVRFVHYSAFNKSFFIFFIIAISGSGCENDEKVIEELTKNVVLTEEATDIVSYLSQQGTMKARLKAPLMIRYPAYDSPYVEFPKSLHVDFYNDSIQIETRLDSKYGKYYETQNKVYLRDSVVVITDKGDTLKAHDLWWDQNLKLFYTDKYSEYHNPGKNIQAGKRLEATQDLRRVTFLDPTGILKTSNSGFPE